MCQCDWALENYAAIQQPRCIEDVRYGGAQGAVGVEYGGDEGYGGGGEVSRERGFCDEDSLVNLAGRLAAEGQLGREKCVENHT